VQAINREIGHRMIGDYDDPETWGESARDARAAADRAKDGAARSTLLWTAERYEQLAEFRGPGKLLQ
jgi:hypothetical protein